MFEVILLLIIFVFPYLLTRLTFWLGTEKWLSPVVLSYLTGIAICNFSTLPIPPEIPELFSQATIVLAIPMLLYSTDLFGWFKLAKSTILSFSLLILSVLIAVTLVGFSFRQVLPETWVVSGMLAGVFVGGTPNMNAVGIALDADSLTIVNLNAADIICGGSYLVFMTSVAHYVFGLFLPRFKGEKKAAFVLADGKPKINWYDVSLALGLTVVLAGVAAGVVYLMAGSLAKSGLIILLISLFSVVASFSPKVRNLRGAFEAGEYLLLMFCVAIGLLADFGALLDSGGLLVIFTAAVLLISVVLHLLFCRLAHIDRDTMMITQTAGFYGPPFIGQIAAVMQNRAVVLSGIATGLVGLAIANFIGIVIAKILKFFFLG